MSETLSQKDLINATLLSFKITTYDFEEIQGAAVTLYKFRPQLGVRVSKIRGLKDEMAAALGVSSVRIIAPLADGSIGIEVPNKQKTILPVKEILCSPEYLTSDMALPLAIGRTVTNDIFMADLADMPHLLVAGATGQGKSVGLNVMLMSLLHKKTPEELKLVLIDPKKVELSVYSKLENTYLASPVITEANEAERVLQSLCELMEERYNLVSSAGKRNIKEYNAMSIVEPMPYIVVVIDEYGDLIMQAGREMERAICRLAQKARAVGIHLIISTQRPSATIVTGNIKANFPTRIAFRTTTGTDSRVILDQTGAERLAGNGDMLFISGADTTRIQCAYASIDDVRNLCDTIQEMNDECASSFKLPVCSTEMKENDRMRWFEKWQEEEEKRKKEWEEENKRDRERIKRDQEFLKKNEIKLNRLYKTFYGNNSAYMTLYVPKESRIFKK